MSFLCACFGFNTLAAYFPTCFDAHKEWSFSVSALIHVDCSPTEPLCVLVGSILAEKLVWVEIPFYAETMC